MYIDPSSTSVGWCMSRNGAYHSSGTIKSKSKGGVGARMDDIRAGLSKLGEFDLMFIELVRPSTGHLYLTWGAGNTVSALRAKKIIEIPEKLWAKCKDKEYYKSDVMDAKYLCRLVLMVLEENDVDT